MPIHDLGPAWRELGKIKLGEEADGRPSQLDTWRLTSRHGHLLDAAAIFYGGTVEPAGEGFELVTDTDRLDVHLPAQDVAAGQWFEHWTRGGLQRRCDGEHLTDGSTRWLEDAPRDSAGLSCVCDPDRRECKPTTVLRVILPDLPDLGIWRLTTRSVYAARELPAAAAALFALLGDFPAAVLTIDHREVKRPGQPAHRFTVPTLGTHQTLREAFDARASLDALPSPHDPPPIPVGDVMAEDPGPATAPPKPAPPPGPVLPPENSPSPPAQRPQTAPNPDPAPLGPETDRDAAWDELVALLDRRSPSTVGGPTAELIADLVAIEARMLELGLWELGTDGALPLDTAAAKWLGPERVELFRADQLATAHLHTFATRALMAIHSATEAHTDARRARARRREDATT